MLWKLGIPALLAVAIPAAAGANTYDALSSFDGSNPAGNFRYGSAGVLLSAPTGDCVAGLSGITCLQTAAGNEGPGFYRSQTSFTISSDGGVNNLHVTSTALLASPDVAGVGAFFIAPTAGTYIINAIFNAQDDLATGVTITGVKSLGGVLTFNPVGPLNSVPANFAFSTTVTLGAGDLYGFSFGPGTNPNHDLTAFNFTVQDGVPEPATWMMMLAGFGIAGGAVRRRTRAATVRGGAIA